MTYRDLSPEAALVQAEADGARLAGTEVLMAAVLFAGWVTSWNGMDSPYPNLSGIQLARMTNWSFVPALRLGADATLLKLEPVWAGTIGRVWASPTVWEC